MEFNTTRLIVSIILVVLGIVYFLKPDKAYRFLYRRSMEDEVPRTTIIRFKYGGLVVAALGVYYILVMFEYIPLFNYWE